MRRIKKLKIVRYFGIGAIAASVNLGIFFVFAKIFGFDYLIVGAVAFLVATAVNYILSIRHVFESGIRFDRKQELFWIYTVSLIGLGIDLTILYICIDLLAFELMFSKIAGIGIVFFWNYYARKHFVFKTIG